MNWQLQEAKARFSEVLKRAEAEGPQHITVRGTPAAVILSEREYARLVGSHESLADFIRRSPLFGQDDVEFSRERSVTREVEL
jgi:prevent-host-death family protein